MKTIYKYDLNVVDRQYLTIPCNPQFLSVQWQYGGPVLWALVDPDNRKESLTVLVFGTGNPVEADALDGMRYLGTVQSDTRPALVWHVFVPEDES